MVEWWFESRTHISHCLHAKRNFGNRLVPCFSRNHYSNISIARPGGSRQVVSEANEVLYNYERDRYPR
jgi:hypothetical protein